ncbi:MAG: methyltransferase domain-containing protein, partial [Rhodospirillales bacterium]|nr:methyltransferase domain-containing protein [Rhodospirillales bacterium]
MLEAARATCDEFDNTRIREGDLEALPLEDATCDAATLLLVLAYVERVDRVLAEAARVIKPGGKLVVVDLLKHDDDSFRRQTGQRHLGFSFEQLGAQLTDAGFARHRSVPLEPESNAKSPALLLTTAWKVDSRTSR